MLYEEESKGLAQEDIYKIARAPSRDTSPSSKRLPKYPPLPTYPLTIVEDWPIKSTKPNRRAQEYKASDIYKIPYKTIYIAYSLGFSRSV
jgi:hypothetical protein